MHTGTRLAYGMLKYVHYSEHVGEFLNNQQARFNFVNMLHVANESPNIIRKKPSLKTSCLASYGVESRVV